MELSIDGILTVIGVIYKNYESYNTNSEQLNILIQKVKLFEMPLFKLKQNIVLDHSIEMHIENLNTLINEIRSYLDDFGKKNKFKKFFGALFIDDKIRDFDTRIDCIKKDLNFEFDLNNHLIFHNFNSRTKEFNIQMEDLIRELRNHQDNKIWLNTVSNFINEQIENRMHEYKISFEYKLNEIQKNICIQQNIIQQQTKSVGTDEIDNYLNHNIFTTPLKNMCIQTNSDDVSPNVSPNVSQNVSPNEPACIPDSIKSNLGNSPLEIISHYINKYNKNLVLKKHFELIMQVLILENTKGHYIYDGQTIFKKTNYTSEVSLHPIKINFSKFKFPKKIYLINVSTDEMDTFKNKHGFSFLFNNSSGNEGVIFEIANFYNSSL